MADILIRGMEMPQERPVWVAIFPDGATLEWNKAHSAARAIPLPEGHGRLIDADALLSVLDILKDKGCDGPVWDQMRDIVENMATIVPAEGGKKHD